MTVLEHFEAVALEQGVPVGPPNTYAELQMRALAEAIERRLKEFAVIVPMPGPLFGTGLLPRLCASCGCVGHHTIYCPENSI